MMRKLAGEKTQIGNDRIRVFGDPFIGLSQERYRLTKDLVRTTLDRASAPGWLASTNLRVTVKFVKTVRPGGIIIQEINSTSTPSAMAA